MERADAHKHTRPTRPHTLGWLLPSAEPLIAAPLSSVVSGLANPHRGPEANNTQRKSVPALLALPTVSSWGMHAPILPASPMPAEPLRAARSPLQCIDPMKPTFHGCTRREVHSYVNLFPSNGRINKFHLCFVGRATRMGEAGRTADYWQAHCPSRRCRLHSPHWGRGRGEGASLFREASCIFLYLSTKSHKRWTVSRLHTAPDT